MSSDRHTMTLEQIEARMLSGVPFTWREIVSLYEHGGTGTKWRRADALLQRLRKNGLVECDKTKKPPLWVATGVPFGPTPDPRASSGPGEAL